MSSAVQCLSNIPELRTYLFSEEMLQEINKKNPLGSKGKVALVFTQLLSRMWYGDKVTTDTIKFK